MLKISYVYYNITVLKLCSISFHRSVTHEQMYDGQQLEETQSAHSIGIVENPLYADNEVGLDEPRFAALSAKEKEEEVNLNNIIMLLVIHIIVKWGIKLLCRPHMVET